MTWESGYRWLCRLLPLLLPLLLGMIPSLALAEGGELPLLTIQDPEGEHHYSLNLKIVGLLSLLAVAPALLMVSTPFTRIIVVLAILRQALGTQQTPSNQILIGLALILTFYILTPTIETIELNAWQPYQSEEIGEVEALKRSVEPLRAFMLNQVAISDLETFASFLAKTPAQYERPEDIPLTILVPAFLTSELKTAMTTGFMLFIPFVVIDLLVASILMGLGMMMMPPAMVSLPLKLIVFVAIDGWTLLSDTLVQGFIL